MTYQSVAVSGARSASMAEVYDPVPPLDLRAMFGVVWRGKWLIMFTTICAILLGGYYAFHMAGPRYGATAALQIDLQPNSLPDVSNQWTGPGTDPASLNTQITVLTSDRILGQLVQELDLLNDPEFNRYLRAQSPFAINALRTRLRHFLAGTTAVPPDTGAIHAKTIQNLRGAMTATRPRDTYLFEITARSASAEKAMTLANTAAALYVNDQLQIKDTASQAAESWLDERVATLRIQLEAQETAVTNLIATAQIQQDSRLDLLSNDVLALEQKLDEERVRLTQLEAQDAIATTPRQSAAIAQQRDLVADMTAQRDRLRRQLSGQSAGLVSLHQMQREADATRALYETFLTRLQQTRLQRGLERPNSQIIAPATAAQYLGPRKVLILLVSGLMGGLIGLGCVTARSLLRRGVYDPKALVTATGVTFFAQTGQSDLRAAWRLRRNLRKATPGALSQAIRAIRARLILAEGGSTPSVILCTSTIAGEGKTAHGVALATALARSGKSVLLLGANGPKVLAKLTHTPANRGLADVIAGLVTLEEVTTKDPHLGFDTVVCGAGDVVLSDQFSALMEALQGDYDHVVIDAPPVLADPTTALLAQSADAVLYFVRWSKTPLESVQTGLARLEEASAPATGLILAKVPARAMAQSHAHGTTGAFATA